MRHYRRNHGNFFNWTRNGSYENADYREWKELLKECDVELRFYVIATMILGLLGMITNFMIIRATFAKNSQLKSKSNVLIALLSCCKFGSSMLHLCMFKLKSTLI